MEWTKCIGAAISYMEEHLTEELTIGEIAGAALLSPFYFQKGFTMLCGLPVGEYIRKRRLSLAGGELMTSDAKVIDLALKYGYDSPDSFTKAFTRFHGATPASVRKGAAAVKAFAPLKIRFTLEGGYTMDYKITEKDQFTLLGVSRVFRYEAADAQVPALWAELERSGTSGEIRSAYGVSIDENMDGERFTYLIGEAYDPARGIPEGAVTRVIPRHTWAVFPCRGAGSRALPETHEKIFSEWLPGRQDYEIAAGYHVEWYGDPGEYARGAEDEAYYSEIWIPVRRK